MPDRTPKIGDRYTPLFQSDLNDAPPEGDDILTVESVEYLCDGGKTWSVTASDGVGYDCVWSDRHQIWCYCLD